MGPIGKGWEVDEIFSNGYGKSHSAQYTNTTKLLANLFRSSCPMCVLCCMHLLLHVGCIFHFHFPHCYCYRCSHLSLLCCLFILIVLLLSCSRMYFAITLLLGTLACVCVCKRWCFYGGVNLLLFFSSLGPTFFSHCEGYNVASCLFLLPSYSPRYLQTPANSNSPHRFS